MKKTRRSITDILKVVIAIIIVSGLISALGITALVIGMQEIIDATSSRDWPEASGTVIHSKIENTETTSTGKRNREYSYQADIKYKYFVNGKTYVGDRISWGEVSNKDIAQRRVDNYPVGREITVYYDPEIPEKSVLEPGYSSGLLFLPLLGIGAILCAIICGVVIWIYGEGLAQTLSSTIGQNFLLRAFATIVGFFAFAGLIIYLMFKYLWGP